MLFRFCLYGFLKNQRYFEPFLALAFLEKGLNFFQIGLLITVREATCFVLEIPSGAIADVCGRRGSMILSFAAYLASFLTLGASNQITMLIPAMALYGVGDAFRTGTHKAMIFAWLRSQGRENERTAVYGFTRSWSQIGSAVSGLLAACFVYLGNNYQTIFLAAALPCVLSIVNFLGYPKDLETTQESRSFRAITDHLVRILSQMARSAGQRRLVLESMGFEGFFEAVKNYLQPVLATFAIALLAGSGQHLSEVQTTALLVGPVYMVLFLLSAYASRKSHWLVERTGGLVPAARRLWACATVLFALLAVFSGKNWTLCVVLGFVALHTLQNLWQPILFSRFDTVCSETDGATTLSVESLARRLSTMILAPTIGHAIDLLARYDTSPYWIIGIAGCAISLVFFWTASAKHTSI